MPGVSWRVPTWFEGNNRTRDRMSTEDPQPGEGVPWILKPEDVQASLDPAGHYLIWIEAVLSQLR